MKNFNLFSAIALFCLAAGFVSCTKTGNENPNVEQDEEILFVIDEATDKANPEIREGLVRCGFIVEVCNPSKPDVSAFLPGSVALCYFIGDGFSEEVFKPGAAFASHGLNYLGRTELMMDPAFITVAYNSEAVKASSEANVTASLACYERLESLSAYQMAQLESALAQRIVAEPDRLFAIQYHDSMEELHEVVAKGSQMSEGAFLMPFSGVALPVFVCYNALVKSGDREEALLKCAGRAILAGDLAISPMSVEEGYTLVRAGEHAALKSPEEAALHRQVHLLKDMQLVGGRYEMVARAEIRDAVAFIRDSEIENINVKSGELTTAGSIIRRLLEEVANLKVIAECERLPYTNQQYLAVNYPELTQRAKKFVIYSMDHALAAQAIKSEFPKIEVSDRAAGLLMALDEQKALDSKISSAFNEHLAAQFADGRAVYLMSAEEAGIALRSGEKAEAAEAGTKILPIFAAKDVFICSNRSLFRADTDSENYFERFLLKYRLILSERDKVAEEFLNPGMAEDFSLYEYTPDGVNFYPSFLEAMAAAAAMGGDYAIGMRAKGVIPVFEQ